MTFGKMVSGRAGGSGIFTALMTVRRLVEIFSVNS